MINNLLLLCNVLLVSFDDFLSLLLLRLKDSASVIDLMDLSLLQVGQELDSIILRSLGPGRELLLHPGSTLSRVELLAKDLEILDVVFLALIGQIEVRLFHITFNWTILIIRNWELVLNFLVENVCFTVMKVRTADRVVLKMVRVDFHGCLEIGSTSALAHEFVIQPSIA